jgi:hypothetical protein
MNIQQIKSSLVSTGVVIKFNVANSENYQIEIIENGDSFGIGYTFKLKCFDKTTYISHQRFESFDLALEESIKQVAVRMEAKKLEKERFLDDCDKYKHLSTPELIKQLAKDRNERANN